jgi:hypothetical protein
MRSPASLISVWAIAAAALAVAPAANAADLRLGSHAMVYSNAPAGFQRAMFAEAKAAGASVIRVDLQLSLFATGRESRDWAALERLNALSREFGMPMLGIVTTTPWYLAQCTGATESDLSYRCPPSDPTAWAAIVGEIAARTRGTFAAIEILNEPDGSWSFTGTPQQYGNMLVAAAAALRSTATGVPVAMGGLMNPPTARWMDQVLAVPGAREAIDIANVHVRGTKAGVIRAVRSWRSWFASRGIDAPLWVTEFGYSSDPEYQRDAEYRGGQAEQARFLVDTIPAMVEAGAAKIFVTLRDNLGGEWGSEGIVTGASDPPVEEPQIRRKLAFAALARLSADWPDSSARRVTAPSTRQGSATVKPHVTPRMSLTRALRRGVMAWLRAARGTGRRG